MKKEDTNLQEKARNIRINVIEMCRAAGSGHCGGSLSAAEIISVLYFDKMNIKPEQPEWEDRDRFVASKGHCAPAVYAALALKGYFPEEELMELRKMGSRLQGHPDMRKLPGIDMSTGSLGMGLSNAIGMALAGKLLEKNYHTYVLLGDGELNEGQVWEAAMSAVKFKVDNITAILDYNGVQLDGPTANIMPSGDMEMKWRSFGWNVLTCDGHSTEELSAVMEKAKETKNVPSIIIAKTIKGCGVSFMEGDYKWHGRSLSKEDYELALRELRCKI